MFYSVPGSTRKEGQAQLNSEELMGVCIDKRLRPNISSAQFPEESRLTEYNVVASRIKSTRYVQYKREGYILTPSPEGLVSLF